MKRSYAYALIVFAIAILGSLVWLHFQLVDQAITPLLSEASHINERVIEQQKDELRSVTKQMEALLEDQLRNRYYRPLLDISGQVESGIEEYLTAQKMIEKNIASAEIAKDLEVLAHRLIKELTLVAEEVFTENKEAFDLSDDNLEDRLKKLAAYAVEKNLNEQSVNLGNEIINQHYRDMITLNFLSRSLDVLYQAAYTISMPCFQFEQYYPIVTTDIANPRPGEQVNARISIATFPYFNPENVQIVVGKDTLRADQDGLVKYTLKAGSRGEHTVPVKCLVTNPLTGGIVRGESYYTYRVY